MATQADLDAALATLTSEVADAVNAIITKVGPAIDLSAEVDQVNAATASLAAALAPPAPPVDEPAPEPVPPVDGESPVTDEPPVSETPLTDSAVEGGADIGIVE